MDIQSLFYLLASIFMILGITVMISILVFMWRVKSSVQAFQKKAENIKNIISERKFMNFVPFINKVLKWLVDRRRENS